jgi:hypothetical protein
MAKKKTGARRGTASADAHERRRERLDARRRAKAEALAAQRRALRRARLVRSVLMGLLAAGVVAFVLLQLQGGNTPDEIGGHRIQKLGETGVNEHVSGTVEYDSTPPSSGPHSPQPAECGVHADPVPNETQTHSLEHGAVAVQYLPTLELEDIRTIERIVSGYDGRVLSAPYPGMETPIAVTSWGEMMRLDSLDADAIRDYIDAFRGRGPEDVACPSTADDPFRPAQDAG